MRNKRNRLANRSADWLARQTKELKMVALTASWADIRGDSEHLHWVSFRVETNMSSSRTSRTPAIGPPIVLFYSISVISFRTM